MLEAAERGQTLAKAEYKKLEPELRAQLIQAQLQLQKHSMPMLIVVSGDDPDGVQDTVGLLSDWMDPRFINTCVFTEPTEEQRLRPTSWRYWQELPQAGRVGVYSNEWASNLLSLRLQKKRGAKRFEEALGAIERFERMLAVDGAIILKLYLHKPLAALSKRKKSVKRISAWSDAAKIALEMIRQPEKSLAVVEQLLQRTGTEFAPWHLVESACPRHRDVEVARLILEAINSQAERADAPKRAAPAKSPRRPAEKSVLDTVDLSLKATDKEYDDEAASLRHELQRLVAKAYRKGVSTVAAFEGWDAAGKGGTIRRIAQSMPPEMYRIVPIASPNDVERSHHYLWRFWRHIPRDGGFVIFDRTWYGRVLVERVEGFASEPEWRRAYDEINHFEERLVEHGIVLLKFWLHIDKDEQLRRFKAREKIPFKQYKIGEEDYRNRGKWDLYVEAINDMVARTSTPGAPWHLIPANDKKYCRLRAMREVVKALERALKP